MTKDQVPAARFFIAALAAGTLLVQLVVLPLTAASMAEQYPELAHLQWPYVIVAGVALLCFETALVAAWRLVSVTVTDGSERGASETGSSVQTARRWIDVATVSLLLMALVSAGLFFHAGFDTGVGGPPMLFGLLGALASVPVVFALRRQALNLVLPRMDAPVPAGSLSGW